MKRAPVVFAALVASCTAQPAPGPGSAQTTAPASIVFTSKSPEAIAHVMKGDALLDNQRPDEALQEFDAALKLDPGFLFAQVEHGVATPGPAGLTEIETAAAAATNLPEPERVSIDAALLARRGESVATITKLQRLTEIAPGYSRGHALLGSFLLNQDKLDEGIAALKKATQADPNNGAAQNTLGYAALRRGDTDGAIAAFREYGRVMPKEPNAQDSLGEALLAAGRFKEAEEAFEKALTLSPQFWSAHQGIAMARYYAGDLNGARDAWAKAKATATRNGDKMSVDADVAAASLAQGNIAQSLKLLEASAQTEGASPAQKVSTTVLRAQTLVVAGRPREVLTLAAEVIKAVESGQFPPAPTRNLRRNALRPRVAAEAQLKDVAAAKQTAAALAAEASTSDDVFARDAMHFAQGALALASGDFVGASAHFTQCSTADEWCRWYGVMSAEKAGDKAGATAAREALLKLYGRSQVHMIVRAQLTKKGA